MPGVIFPITEEDNRLPYQVYQDSVRADSLHRIEEDQARAQPNYSLAEQASVIMPILIGFAAIVAIMGIYKIIRNNL